MIDDRARQKLSHPSRAILRRAAATGQLPDPAELDELGLPPELTERVRECAEVIADLGDTGLRGKARARAYAESLSDEIAESTPRGRRGALPPRDSADDLDAHALAEAIVERQREHEAEHLDIEDRDAERQAVRELRQARRHA